MRYASFALLCALLSGVALGACTCSIPSQPPIRNITKLPTHYAALVYPHYQAIDLFGPLDLFNSLSMIYANETKMHLSILAKSMEPVSTAMMPTGFGETIMPTMTFKDYLSGKNATGGHNDPSAEDCDDGHGGHAVAKRSMRFGARQMDHGNGKGTMSPSTSSDPGDIDVLIVPGGGGSRRNLIEEIAFVKAIYPKLQYIISICTGASILAQAGVLDNKKATTNKRSWAWVLSTGGNSTTWVPTARWVHDGNVWTTSGIHAGIDGAFAFVSHVYSDPVADYMAKSLEFERQTNEHHDPFGKVWGVPGAV